MKESAGTAGDDRRFPETEARGAPAAGFVSLVSGGLRRLIRSASRKSPAEGAVGPEQQRRSDPSAYRSAMDAGITGGISLLGTSFRNGKGRR